MKRTGFRTVVVDQTNFSVNDVNHIGIQPGSKFQIEINGKEMYIQGSNVIPFDTLYA